MVRQKGFSLIETVIAICVLTALGAVAAPKLWDLDRAQGALEADKLKAQLASARAAAQAAGRPVYASFADGGAVYCWTNVCAVGSVPPAPALALTGQPLKQELPSGLALSASAPSAVFAPDGSVSAPLELAIGASRVSVDAYTGIASRRGG